MKTLLRYIIQVGVCVLALQTVVADGPRYLVIPLYPGGSGDKINNHGDVVGMFNPNRADPANTNYAWRIFTHNDQHGSNVIEWPYGFSSSILGYNDQRRILVMGYDTNYENTIDIYIPGVGFERFGPTNALSDAFSLNNSNQVCGSVRSNEGDTTAYVYDETMGTQYYGYGIGRGINDHGWVAGYTLPIEHAVLWKSPNEMVEIMANQSQARGINNQGAVCGVYFDSNEFKFGGFIYYEGVIQKQLHSIYSLSFNVINGYREVIGYAREGHDDEIPIYYNERHGLHHLSALIFTNSGWQIDSVNDINDRGQITGEGRYMGQIMAYRLDPIPPKLGVGLEGTNAIVSWYPDWPGVVLETADDPAATNWQLVATGETNVIVLPRTAPAQYFRLTRPPPPEISPGGVGR